MSRAFAIGAAAWAALTVAGAVGMARFSALSSTGGAAATVDRECGLPIGAGAGAGAAAWPAATEQAAILGQLAAAAAGAPVAAAATSATEWRGTARLFCGGRAVVRVEIASHAGRGLAEPILDGEARAALAAERDRAGCRWKVDVERARGRLLAVAPLFAFSIVPGLDGLGARFRDDGGGAHDVVLLPDELVAADLLTGARPIPGVPDVELGLDGRRALGALAARAGLGAGEFRRRLDHLFRVRHASFVEGATPDAPAVALLRSHRAALTPVDAAHLEEGALHAGRYLVAHLSDEGRFDYEYFPLRDQAPGDEGGYSLPRHAGAADFLALLAAPTDDASAIPAADRARFRDAARRAIAFLVAAAPPGCDGTAPSDVACVGGRGDRLVDLGSTALALLAADDYERATGDHAFAPFADRAARFLEMMQRSNGSFAHLYAPAAHERDEQAVMLYFSGEAALALARHARVRSPDERTHLAPLVDRALAHLTVDDYGYFAARFFYGEDHWTCQAVEEAWPLLEANAAMQQHREGYADFCEGFAAYLARTQFLPGEGPTEEQPDLVGAYGITPLSAPHTTPAGSRAETLLSILRIAAMRQRAQVVEEVRRQLGLAFSFALGRQIGRDTAFAMPSPERADGGFPMNDAALRVRVDVQQHVGSALLRASRLPRDLLPQSPSPSERADD